MNDKFIPKLYQMLEDANLSKIMSWSEDGDAVMIWSEENLGRILPRYGFKTNNFSAIQRQLNYYGFKKTTQGKNPTVYMHEYFYRGSPYLNEIKKRTAIKAEAIKAEAIKEATRVEVASSTVATTRRTTRSSTAKSSSWPSSPSFTESIVLDPLPLEQPFEPEHVSLAPLSSVPSVSPSVSTSLSLSLPFSFPQEGLEIQRLSEENRMLKDEMIRLREQQEQTQMLMREMFAQLQQNKEETNALKNLVHNLTQPQMPQMIDPVITDPVITDPVITQILEEIFSQTQDLSAEELSTQVWDLDEIRFGEIAIQN